MANHLQCKKCEKKYAFPEALRGKSVICKACGHRMAVPEAQEEEGEYDVAGGARTVEEAPVAPAAKPVKSAKSAWAASMQSGGSTVARPTARTAESIVDNNEGIAALEKFYKGSSALDFYARRRCATFSNGRVSNNCACCKGPADAVRALTWSCDNPGTTEKISFVTYHRVCGGCWTAFQMRKLGAGIALVVLLIIAVAVAIPIAFSLRQEGVTSRGSAMVAGLLLAIPIVGASFLIRRFKIPGPLRFMSGGRFGLKKLETL